MPKRQPSKAKTQDDGDKRPVTVYLPADLHKELKHQGIEEGRTASEIATDAIRAYLKAHKT